jgi:hypothetical protein
MLTDFLFILVGLLLLIPLFSLAKAQRKTTLAGAVPLAVEIAKVHSWVSKGRLMTHANITEQDAKAALEEACQRGLLAPGGDGRYHVKQTVINSDSKQKPEHRKSES